MSQPAIAPITPKLGELIESVRAAVRRESDLVRRAERVAEALRVCLAEPDLLTDEQREPSERQYRQHVLHVEPDGGFSIVALVWLPGQATPIHDHVSWCVVGVYQGEEYETRYLVEQASDPAHLMEVGAAHSRPYVTPARHDPRAGYLVEVGASVNPNGSVAALTPPGDIHKVANHCQGLAISLHIYGADIAKLGSSIRRKYDLEVK